MISSFSTNSPIVTFSQVTIGYPGHPILQKLNLEISRGDALAIVGQNGAGKTAFLKTVAGILRPLSGTVHCHHPSKSELVRVGYVPQQATVSGLLPLTVREVVEMGTFGTLNPWQRVGKKELDQLNWALDQVGMTDLQGKQYSGLSGGQQQRVLIARALAMNPSVLVLDEPLASLDRHSVRSMINLLNSLRAQEHMTILWVDHLLPALHQVVQEVLLVEDGCVTRLPIEILMDRERQLLSTEGSELNV